MTRAKRINGEVVDVTPLASRRKPVKPSERVYVRKPENPDPELFEFEDDAGPQYVDVALQGVMAELGATDDEAKVTVSRIQSSNGVRRESWLFECHPREFSIAEIQNFYGEGDYRVKVFGLMEGTNYKGIHADKKISIGPGRNTPKTEALPVPAAASRDADQLTRALTAAITQPMMALAQALSGALPKGNSRADALAEFAQFAEIMRGMQPQPSAPVDPMQAFERAVKVMAELRAGNVVGEDGEVSSGAVFSQGLAIVRELIAAHAANAAQRPPQPNPTPPRPGALPPGAQTPHAPAPPPIRANPQPSPEDDEMNLFLKMQLRLMLTAAESKGDPNIYAGMIYENAPEEILKALESETWFETLCALEPKFAPHKEWCGEVRDIVLAEIKAESLAEADKRFGQPHYGHDSENLTETPGGSISAGNDAPPK